VTPGTLLARTKQWLRTHNIRVTKRLGQHFLIDAKVLTQIIEYANLSNSDRILEIGTGNGVLTQHLADKVEHVYTVEKDSRFYQILATELASDNRITLIHGDAVQIGWPKVNKLVANLPYTISSPVLFKFFEADIPMAVVMLQKEFAERLIAEPNSKQYGRLTVMAAYHAKIKLLEYIAPESFYPPPAVDSAIVQLHQQKISPFVVKDKNLFGKLTTALFNQRRKKIRTPLKVVLGNRRFQQIHEKLPWLNQRVEELSPEQIANIANIISEERNQ
jgi:16S rRNA (adenine1518-N6/adenine1519-N6)-dimethyltransferase